MTTGVIGGSEQSNGRPDVALRAADAGGADNRQTRQASSCCRTFDRVLHTADALTSRNPSLP
eukprot:289136-Prymnesium_polylepis.1